MHHWQSSAPEHQRYQDVKHHAYSSSTTLLAQCSYSGGSYQQHLGMLEQWIDNSGRPQPDPTSANGRPRKGAKTAGE